MCPENHFKQRHLSASGYTPEKAIDATVLPPKMRDLHGALAQSVRAAES